MSARNSSFLMSAGSETAPFAYATAYASDRAGNATPGKDPRQGEPMLTQVADGVWVRQSEWVWTNSIVVRGEGGLILVDPGIDGSELNQLADDLDRLGIPVVAGFSTHPHWDHLLWHPRFGDVPRYATHAGAHVASGARERAQRWRRRARRASLSS
jgi:glyoxylase-like metal-dependent hydrolase (beta-lactamase superfamily II)